MINKLSQEIYKLEMNILGGLKQTLIMEKLAPLITPEYFLNQSNREVYEIIYNSYLEDQVNWFGKSITEVRKKLKREWFR